MNSYKCNRNVYQDSLFLVLKLTSLNLFLGQGQSEGNQFGQLNMDRYIFRFLKDSMFMDVFAKCEWRSQ